MKALALDTLSRGYLASNQLIRLQNASDPHVEANVVTMMSLERRQFSWIWDLSNDRALLANRLTGTLFDPVSGEALLSTIRIVEAPIEVPELEPGEVLPAGIFSTEKH